MYLERTMSQEREKERRGKREKESLYIVLLPACITQLINPYCNSIRLFLCLAYSDLK